MDLVPGTLAVHRGSIVFVTRVENAKKYPIIFKKALQAKGTYHDRATGFSSVIGSFDLKQFNEISGSPARTIEADDDVDLDAVEVYIKGLNIDDDLLLKSGKTAKYRGWVSRRPVMPISATINGRPFKLRPDSIVLPKDKRSEDVIMEEVLDVYCGLSPENLTSDGEVRASAVVNQRYRELKKQLRGLCSELGRDVSETEAYSYPGNMNK